VGAQLDHYVLWDDVAMQSGMMMSPAQWNRYLKKWYETLYADAKKYALKKSIERNTELVDTKGEPFVLQPGQLVLGITRERIAVPNDLVASIEGRSSVARMGVFIHISSGHVNPGSGARDPIPVTLEILNMNPSPVKLYPGMRICQLLFYTMDRAVRVGYDDLGGKYAGKLEPSGSIVFKDNLSPR